MAKGKTKSKLKLGERRDKAFSYYQRGYTDRQVAESLDVSMKTARSYRALYERQLTDEVFENPSLLRDVLKNTIRNLKELDEVRADAWLHVEEKDVRMKVECEECGKVQKVQIRWAPTHDVRIKYHAVLIRAQEARAKLLGALGIKQDILVAVTEVRETQRRMMGWLMENLSPDQREELAAFLAGTLNVPSLSESPGAIFDGLDVGSVVEATAVEATTP